MSNKHAMPEMKEGGVNVTPLIDVVMCLIIFFMLVAKIGVATGASKKMRLPETIIGKKIDKLGMNWVLNIDDPTIERDSSLPGNPPKLDADGKVIRRSGYEDQANRRVFIQRELGLMTVSVVAPEKDQAAGIITYNEKEKAAKAREVRLTTELVEVVRAKVKHANKAKAEKKAKGQPLNEQDEFSVTLRCERSMPYLVFQEIIKKLNEAGVKNINYGTVNVKKA